MTLYTTNVTPLCDYNCQQQKQREYERQSQIRQEQQKTDFQNGYAAGQAIGYGIAQLIHRLSIKQDGYYTIKRDEKIDHEFGEIGMAMACKKKDPQKCRIVEAPIEIQGYLTMVALGNAIRKSNADPELKNNPFTEGSVKNWNEMQEMYCRNVRLGKLNSVEYLDLDGKTQKCQ